MTTAITPCKATCAPPSPAWPCSRTPSRIPHVYDALRAGASGFLLKDVERERLVEAVHTVAGGESLFAPTVVRRLVDHYVARPPAQLGRPPALDPLSERVRTGP